MQGRSIFSALSLTLDAFSYASHRRIRVCRAAVYRRHVVQAIRLRQRLKSSTSAACSAQQGSQSSREGIWNSCAEMVNITTFLSRKLRKHKQDCSTMHCSSQHFAEGVAGVGCLLLPPALRTARIRKGTRCQAAGGPSQTPLPHLPAYRAWAVIPDCMTLTAEFRKFTFLSAPLLLIINLS